jgi:hypothetical protein
MNSGVGPLANLDSVGVNTIVDNKTVGANMKDNPTAVVNYETVDDGPLGDPKLPEAVGEW